MSQETDNHDGYVELPDNRSPADIEQERQIERLEEFFSILQPGTTLLIERIQPSWCSGLLEEITISEDTINLDYFIQTWGGRLLAVVIRGKGGKLHGRHRIPLYTFPPLIYGELLSQTSPMEIFRSKGNRKEETPFIMSPQQTVSSTVDPLATLPALLKLLESQRQSEMAMMLQLVKPQSSGSLGGIGDKIPDLYLRPSLILFLKRLMF